MKNMIIFSLAALAMAGCAVDDKYYGTYPEEWEPPYKIDWYAAADSSTNMVLIDHFWMEPEDAVLANTYWYFNGSSDKQSRSNSDYWPQAHCIDVIVDAYIRTGEEKYKQMMADWFVGVPNYQYAKNANPWAYNPNAGAPNNGWFNSYVDDMEWIVLSLLRMYEVTGIEDYLDVGKLMYDAWIITSWDYDDNGGGLRWTYDGAHPKSKNACSNGPGALIAARLYNITKEEKYLDDAIMIYNWLKTVLYIPGTGAVNDAISFGKIGDWTSTYNQGTFLGAAVELYRITGRSSYLKEAQKAAEYTMTDLTDASGKLLVGAHFGDMYLFNGIFVRYFVLLANEKDLDKTTRRKYYDFLEYQATTVWTKGIIKDDPDGYGMLYSGYLDEPGYFRAPLGTCCTGCTIVEAMSALEPIN